MKKIVSLLVAFLSVNYSTNIYAQNAEEKLTQIGRCLSINFQYLQDKKTLPKGNAAYNEQWKKAAEAYVSVYQSEFTPCTKRGGTQESCINQLSSGMQPLFRGFSNGTYQYSEAKKKNDWGRIEFLMLACTS
jgi:hypothetical protein